MFSAFCQSSQNTGTTSTPAARHCAASQALCVHRWNAKVGAVNSV
jgi:hypothetical protein